MPRASPTEPPAEMAVAVAADVPGAQLLIDGGEEEAELVEVPKRRKRLRPLLDFDGDECFLPPAVSEGRRRDPSHWANKETSRFRRAPCRPGVEPLPVPGGMAQCLWGINRRGNATTFNRGLVIDNLTAPGFELPNTEPTLLRALASSRESGQPAPASSSTSAPAASSGCSAVRAGAALQAPDAAAESTAVPAGPATPGAAAATVVLAEPATPDATAATVDLCSDDEPAPGRSCGHAIAERVLPAAAPPNMSPELCSDDDPLEGELLDPEEARAKRAIWERIHAGRLEAWAEVKKARLAARQDMLRKAKLSGARECGDSDEVDGLLEEIRQTQRERKKVREGRLEKRKEKEDPRGAAAIQSAVDDLFDGNVYPEDSDGQGSDGPDDELGSSAMDFWTTAGVAVNASAKDKEKQQDVQATLALHRALMESQQAEQERERLQANMAHLAALFD